MRATRPWPCVAVRTAAWGLPGDLGSHLNMAFTSSVARPQPHPARLHLDSHHSLLEASLPSTVPPASPPRPGFVKQSVCSHHHHPGACWGSPSPCGPRSSPTLMTGGPSAAALTPRVAEGPTWMPDADRQDEPCASVKEGRPGERRGGRWRGQWAPLQQRHRGRGPTPGLPSPPRPILWASAGAKEGQRDPPGSLEPGAASGTITKSPLAEPWRLRVRRQGENRGVAGIWLEKVSLARWGDGGSWGHRRAAGGRLVVDGLFCVVTVELGM